MAMYVVLCMDVWLHMCGYVWLCMAMYGYVWLCMAMYGYVWLYLAMYGYVWLCMAMYVCIIGRINPIYKLYKLKRMKYKYKRYSSFRPTSLNHLAAILEDKDARTATTQNNSSDGRKTNKLF